MTLEPYTPQRIDQLALRVFDCAAALRAIATQARQEEVEPLDLHDKKALEYLARLEDWIHKAEGTLQVNVRRAQGKRRAKGLRAPGAAPKA